jgi:transcriptional accessory protein Tex/SPT6
LLGGQCCYVSAIPFIKVKIPEDDISASYKQSLDLRDQTRIHIEYYDLALTIASDACQQDGEPVETDQAAKLRMLKEVIMNPSKLARLDMKGYYKQLELTGRSNYKYVIEQMIKEFTDPFKDPRTYRSPTSINIKNERLLYLLIDESKRTFKTGIIVTATVNKVLDTKAICRLDNGLTAIIPSTKLIEQDSAEKLKDIIDVGHIVTGRIIQIKSEDEKSFEVMLNCKQSALSSHEEFKAILAASLGVNPDMIPKEDLMN